ncbi:7693_t:CDS:1, partial [Funneliformis geosporum]
MSLSSASASGLQRRRNAGALNSNSSSNENNMPTTQDRTLSSGVRIAVDPNEILDDEDKKQPNLTLMEEVLLLGLKDKQ